MAKITIDQRPEGMDCGLARVVMFSSQSRERKHYTMVFQGPQGGVQCSCEGWQNHGHCWHIEKLTEDQLRRPDGSEADVDGDFVVKLSAPKVTDITKHWPDPVPVDLDGEGDAHGGT